VRESPVLWYNSARVRITSVVILGMLGLVGCSERRGELREWKPSDHQGLPTAEQGDTRGEGVEDSDPVVRAAAALWKMQCSGCHGARGLGDGQGKPPGMVLPDMTSEAFQDARTDAQLAEVIAKGRGAMPAFEAEITEAGRAALVKHIRALRVK